MALSIIGGEFVAYLLYKSIRNDSAYHLRVDEKWEKIIVLIGRTVSKIMADYTGCFHFRHPYELGGSVFVVTVVLSIVFPYFSLQFFEGEVKDR